MDVNDSVISGNSAINGRGGGIHNNSDSLYLYRSTIDGNQAAEGGGLYQSNPNENFIYSSIYASTISNNQAIAAGILVGRGGGISVVDAPLEISNSTLSGNQAEEDGGGLYVGVVNNGSGVSLRSTTVAANRADSNDDGDGAGGGVYHDGTGNVYLFNTLVATNLGTSGSLDNVWGALDPASISNLISPLNPLIGPLQDNGGPTLTHALLAGSPAIDAATPYFFDDQRGFRRVQNSGSPDIGAYERVLDFGDAPTPFPTTLANSGARHVIGALRLGNFIDSEDDGQPSTAGFANRDDNEWWPDDEDGVTFSSAAGGFMARVDIVASGSGFVSAWMDTNLNGTWDPSEQIITNAPVTAGVNTIFYTIPAIPPSVVGDFTAITRVRLSSTGGLSPTGSAEDGEVEDYALRVQRSRVAGRDGGGTFTFTETVPAAGSPTL